MLKTTGDVLEAAHRAGVRLLLCEYGCHIRARPASALTDELREAIPKRKAIIIKILKENEKYALSETEWR